LYINAIEVGDYFIDSFMAEKPEYNKIKEFYDYLVNNRITSKIPVPLVFGLVLVLIQVLLQTLAKIQIICGPDLHIILLIFIK